MSAENLSAPVIVIFGITGDLSKRKLLPALYHLLKEDMLPADTKIIGTSRHELTNEEIINTVELCVLEKDKVCDPIGLEKISRALQTIKLDPSLDADYSRLKSLTESFDLIVKRDWIFYMSVPSKAYETIISHLAANGLNDERCKILLEKPFGFDLASADKLINQVDEAFDENQVYRIDHYLAKETAQNLLAFRLHNPIFTPLWNCEHIESVHIRALETIGVEGRPNFYEQTGALRDIIQSHLMQLLSIALMDLPEDMGSEAIHDAKLKFFEGLKPADPSDAFRAQYESYRQEVNNPTSNVETFAEIKLRHETSKWKNTEIILETGKGMDKKTTDIRIAFKTPGERKRNNLTFRIQPDEGISLDLVVKEPGLSNGMHYTALDFRYDSTFKDNHYVDAYERVLMDVIRGDQSLFASDQEVLATWRVLQPVIDAWSIDKGNVKTYKVGSMEPKFD